MMKFKLKSVQKVQQNGTEYNLIELVDAESNNWESEITLRLTDTELAKMLSKCGENGEWLAELTLMPTTMYDFYIQLAKEITNRPRRR